MIIPLVGCSKSEDTPTATIKTPIQLVNDRVNNSDMINTRQDQSLLDLSNRITTEVGAVTHYDDAPILARIVALEGLNLSAISAQITYLTLQLQDIADDNLSARLTALETKVNAHITATPTVNATPTPTANVTPTPTAVPTPIGSLTKPIALYPTIGNTTVINGSILFQWTECNATVYEFWFGNNSNNLALIDTLDSDVQSFLWPATDSDTYYFWRIRAIVGTTVKSSSFWFKTSP